MTQEFPPQPQPQPQPPPFPTPPPTALGYAPPPLAYAQAPRDDVRYVATRQKGVIFCILAQIVLGVLQFVFPPDLRLFVGLASMAASVAGTVFVFMLALRLYSTATGVVLGVLTLIPCVGLIVLLVVNSRATAFLQRHGVKVGLLGARMRDVPETSAT